jgi:fido (protein-threonine AMPylation protein)
MRAHNPGDRSKLLRALADRVAEQGGCLLIDVHNYVFDDTLFPGWAGTYRRLWEYLLNRGDFWFGVPAEIAEHCTARYESLVQASHGLREGRA